METVQHLKVASFVAAASAAAAAMAISKKKTSKWWKASLSSVTESFHRRIPRLDTISRNRRHRSPACYQRQPSDHCSCYRCFWPVRRRGTNQLSWPIELDGGVNAVNTDSSAQRCVDEALLSARSINRSRSNDDNNHSNARNDPCTINRASDANASRHRYATVTAGREHFRRAPASPRVAMGPRSYLCTMEWFGWTAREASWSKPVMVLGTLLRYRA